MKVISPFVELMEPPTYDELLQRIEWAGRVCYKSEHRITKNSSVIFAQSLVKRGHEAVLEHGSLSVRFICDRGVSHEIVRHRMASYCQESTRYCNYSKGDFGGEITVIKPCYADEGEPAFEVWKKACLRAELAYFDLLTIGCTPQEARAVLPNSLKTEVVMTANLRELRHFLKLRCSPAAHPQMREVADMLYALLRDKYPVFFEDIEV